MTRRMFVLALTAPVLVGRPSPKRVTVAIRDCLTDAPKRNPLDLVQIRGAQRRIIFDEWTCSRGFTFLLPDGKEGPHGGPK